MARFLPRQDVPIAEQGGRTSNPFYVFLQEVERALQTGALSSDGLQEQIAAIATALGSPDGTVANIPPPSDQTGQIQGLQSLRAFGQLPGLVRVTLANDLSEVPPSHFYGTVGNGERGWYALVDAVEAPADGLALTMDGLLYLGTLASEADLPAVGEAGTVYLIDGDAYTWDGAAWQNGGPPAGVPGYVPADDLAAVEGLTGTGLAVRTAADTWATRTLADTATIEWVNGDGVAGNPAATLKDLADTGTGTFQLITRDAKGRLSGTADGTTSDVPEGANLYFTDGRADARIEAQKGVALGLTPLNSATQIDLQYIPASVLGQVEYKGTWDASTGTAPTATPEKGWYYVTTVAGSTNLDGITDWKVGDWAIYSGTAWNKVDNTDAIASWNGRTGAVMPQAGDYTPAQVGAIPASLATPLATPNTVALRGITGDITTRAFRSELADESSFSGALAFRIDAGSNNYIRFISNPEAVRSWLGIGDSGWLSITPLNSWSSLGGAFGSPAYRKIGKRVEMRGVLGGGSMVNNTAVCTLPVGYRPAQSLLFPAGSSSSMASSRLTVLSNGDVQLRDVDSNSFLSLANIAFSID